MNKTYYIYCNSEASSVTGQKGWIGRYSNGAHRHPLKKKKGEHRFPYSIYTTTELIFATQFKSFEKAHWFLDHYELAGIIFERVD